VIVPVQAEYYALEGLQQLLQSINLIKARLNPRLSVGGLLITMSDGRTNLAADVEREVRRRFGPLVFDTVVPRSVRIAEAPSHGCRSRTTIAAPAAPRPTGRWRWSLSNAASPRRGLGRGFDVLIGGSRPPELAHVRVDQIHANPRQPRRRFEHEATAGLADSIRSQGVIQPVVLRSRIAGGYELIAGERRWRAAREAGAETVPAVIREADDRDTLLLGLVENVARENLTPIEEARGYAVLLDEFELRSATSERVGRSKPAISNKLRLLELSDDVLAMVERGELTRATPGPCSRSPGRRSAAGSPGRSSRRGCPCAPPSGRRAGRGPGRSRGRRATSIPSSPAG
jgi:ParB/RepB/Spo0J family partition protein